MRFDPEADLAQRDSRDATLIRLIREDDETAFDKLLRAYVEKLLDVAASFAGEDAAEDIVQEVFIKLWDTRHKLDIQGTIAAYLYRAVRNRSLDFIKHERVQASLESNLGALHDYKEPLVVNAGEVALLDGELRMAFEQALRELSPKLRETFLLRTEHNLSYPEIAQALGIEVTSVHKQMYRATQLMAEKLGLKGNS